MRFRRPCCLSIVSSSLDVAFIEGSCNARRTGTRPPLVRGCLHRVAGVMLHCKRELYKRQTSNTIVSGNTSGLNRTWPQARQIFGSNLAVLPQPRTLDPFCPREAWHAGERSTCESLKSWSCSKQSMMSGSSPWCVSQALRLEEALELKRRGDPMPRNPSKVSRASVSAGWIPTSSVPECEDAFAGVLDSVSAFFVRVSVWHVCGETVTRESLQAKCRRRWSPQEWPGARLSCAESA